MNRATTGYEQLMILTRFLNGVLRVSGCFFIQSAVLRLLVLMRNLCLWYCLIERMLLLLGNPVMLSNFREIQVFAACLSLSIGLSLSGYAAFSGSWCVDCISTMIWHDLMFSLLRRHASRGVLGVEGGALCMLPIRASLNKVGSTPCMLPCATALACSFSIFSARPFVLLIVSKCLVKMALRRLELIWRSLVVSSLCVALLLGEIDWLIPFVICSM